MADNTANERNRAYRARRTAKIEALAKENGYLRIALMRIANADLSRIPAGLEELPHVIARAALAVGEKE